MISATRPSTETEMIRAPLTKAQVNQVARTERAPGTRRFRRAL